MAPFINITTKPTLKQKSVMIFNSELKRQRKLVKTLKKKSLWSRPLEDVASIMPLHPQVSRGVFAELKGSSAGICFYLKADLIVCAFLYNVIQACVHVDLMDGCAFGLSYYWTCMPMCACRHP